jgi:hypothetical protein
LLACPVTSNPPDRLFTGCRTLECNETGMIVHVCYRNRSGRTCTAWQRPQMTPKLT